MLSRMTFAALALSFATVAHAASLDTPDMSVALGRIAHEWARVTYEVKGSSKQEELMKALAIQTARIAARYPGRAEPLVWEGVIASSEAKYSGMFSALGFAKQARDIFEIAGRLDYRALDGAIPTSLGALYYMVPGFPIGFGDNEKARQYLEQAVEMNPSGLDSNYFYGDFLYGQGEYQKAAAVLRRALTAPHDAQRPVWDAGRRAEIRVLLSKTDRKLASDR
jgi:tetratricopeptide (TPR) repeat protein